METSGAGEMAKRVKQFLTNPRDMSSIPKTHIVKGENQFKTVFF